MSVLADLPIKNVEVASLVNAGEMPIVCNEETIIPVFEETVSVGKRILERGGVRIIKTVSTEDISVEEPTVQESVSLDRITVNRVLEAGEPIPVARREGDTLIIPIFEEVVVVEKRVKLTEELHIRQIRTETTTPQSTTIRRETVRVEPISSSDDLLESQA